MDFAQHGFLNLKNSGQLLIHLVLQLLIFESFPLLEGSLCLELVLSCGFLLSEMDYLSHNLPLILNFVPPSPQEDLFGDSSILGEVLAHDQKSILHFQSLQFRVLW